MRLLALAVTVVLLTLVAAACGDQPDAGDGDPTATPACRADACDTPQPGPTSTVSAAPGTPSASETVSSTPTPEPPASSPVPGAGTLRGYVHIGPTCPVVREGEDCDDRPYEADLDVFEGSTLVITLRSDASGNFSGSVPAGDYVLVPRNDGRFPYAADQAITIEPGAVTTVDVAYDSGIR